MEWWSRRVAGCNLFCSELGKEGESGYIYFIISDGNEKKKIYFKQGLVGSWKRKKKEDKEDSSKRLHG